jgi:hypothetical protein
MNKIKEQALGSVIESEVPSLVDKVLEKDEKELLEEEELEKHFLKTFVVKLWRKSWTLGVTVTSYFPGVMKARRVRGRLGKIKNIVRRANERNFLE